MIDDDRKAEPTPIVRRLSRVFDGFLCIDEAVVTYPNYDGQPKTVTRLCMERGDSVAVLVVEPVRCIVWLVEQFRYPALAKGPGWLVEIPAGVIDMLEESEDAALRETREEIGVEPTSLEHIATFYVSPGGTSERIHLYYASVPNAVADEALAQHLRDKDEDIKIVEQKIDAFIADAFAGRIADAKTLIAAFWLDKHRRRLKL